VPFRADLRRRGSDASDPRRRAVWGATPLRGVRATPPIVIRPAGVDRSRRRRRGLSVAGDMLRAAVTEEAGPMVTIDDIRGLTSTLPRSEEHLVRDRVKFRVGKIVYVALSRDETTMGCAFPKEEREAMVAAEPEKFLMPRVSDQRFNWIEVRLAAVSVEEMRELVLDAWRSVVPKRVAAEHARETAREPA
jgi:hypothetical protein